MGNQAVHQLIKSGTMQTKLKTNQAGDTYEQEADRVAEEVMQMPKSQVVTRQEGDPSIEPACFD